MLACALHPRPPGARQGRGHTISCARMLAQEPGTSSKRQVVELPVGVEEIEHRARGSRDSELAEMHPVLGCEAQLVVSSTVLHAPVIARIARYAQRSRTVIERAPHPGSGEVRCRHARPEPRCQRSESHRGAVGPPRTAHPRSTRNQGTTIAHRILQCDRPPVIARRSWSCGSMHTPMMTRSGQSICGSEGSVDNSRVCAGMLVCERREPGFLRGEFLLCLRLRFGVFGIRDLESEIGYRRLELSA